MAEEKKTEEVIPTERDPKVTDADIMTFPGSTRVEATESDTDTGDDTAGGTAKSDGPVEIEIGGKKYKVDSETAAAYQAEVKRLSTPTRERVEVIRDRPVEAKAPEKPSIYDRGAKEIFTNPKQFLTEFASEIRKEVMQEVGGRYTQDQGIRQFWSDFYSDNPDLKKADSLVQATLNEHVNELADLPTKQAAKKLAELSHERIMGIATSFGFEAKKTTKKDNRAGVETASGGERRGAVVTEDNKVKSISSIIRERQAARQVTPKSRATVA